MLQALLNIAGRELRDYSDVDCNISDNDRDFLDKNQVELECLEGIRKEKYRSYKLRKKISFPAGVVLTLILGCTDLWNLYFGSSALLYWSSSCCCSCLVCMGDLPLRAMYQII